MALIIFIFQDVDEKLFSAYWRTVAKQFNNISEQIDTHQDKQFELLSQITALQKNEGNFQIIN